MRDVLTNLELREDNDKELCQTEQAVVDVCGGERRWIDAGHRRYLRDH
jgi:hypothetical protein